jgi:ArsR family transcriptional regulator
MADLQGESQAMDLSTGSMICNSGDDIRLCKQHGLSYEEAEMTQSSIFEIQAELCRCMSSALRIEIVHVLRDGPQRVGEIARITGQPHATISRNLAVLRNGGVVNAQRRGQDVIYQIANLKIVSICDLMREVLIEEASRRSKLVEGIPDQNQD